MEPVSSLTAAAIATLVITKAFEKVGEKLGEEVFTEGGKLTQVIRLHSPQTGSAIELAQQQPLNYGEAVLEQVEADAKTHPEIAAAVEQVAATAKADPKFPPAVQKLEEAIKSQTTTIHNYGKIAEALPNLKAVFQGSTIHGGVTF